MAGIDHDMHAGKHAVAVTETSPARPAAALAAGLLLVVTGCTGLPVAESEPAPGNDAPGSRAENVTRPLPGLALLDPQHAEREIARQMDKLARRNDLAMMPADAGYYMDILEADLRQMLQDSPVEVFPRETSILLRIPGSFVFATGHETLEETARPLLARIAQVAGRYEATLVIVDSHTDPAGDAAINLELSKRRAITVSRHLVDQGVDLPRIIAFGHGESRPLNESESGTGDGSSRRIEIRLLPIIREQASQSAG